MQLPNPEHGSYFSLLSLQVFYTEHLETCVRSTTKQIHGCLSDVTQYNMITNKPAAKGKNRKFIAKSWCHSICWCDISQRNLSDLLLVIITSLTNTHIELKFVVVVVESHPQQILQTPTDHNRSYDIP